MHDLANLFAEDEVRRAVLSTSDPIELRKFALQTLELMRMQRQVFDRLMQVGPRQSG